jgi:hypothetical protein
MTLISFKTNTIILSNYIWPRAGRANKQRKATFIQKSYENLNLLNSKKLPKQPQIDLFVPSGALKSPTLTRP